MRSVIPDQVKGRSVRSHSKRQAEHSKRQAERQAGRQSLDKRHTHMQCLQVSTPISSSCYGYQFPMAGVVL